VPEIDLVDDAGGRPAVIYEQIGRRPIAAFGNSDRRWAPRPSRAAPWAGSPAAPTSSPSPARPAPAPAARQSLPACNLVELMPRRQDSATARSAWAAAPACEAPMPTPIPNQLRHMVGRVNADLPRETNPARASDPARPQDETGNGNRFGGTTGHTDHIRVRAAASDDPLATS
jgi:hypothetical protein